MKTIPIQKIILATLAFAFSNWKKLLESSIFPFLMAFPLITIFSEYVDIMNQLLNGGEVQFNFQNLLYPLLFIYGYMALLINIYRIAVKGNNSIVRFGIVLPNRRLGRFFLITLLLSIAEFPSFIFNVLGPFIYFLLIPISLNLVSIANDIPYKKIKLSIGVWGNIFLVNFGLLYIILQLLLWFGVGNFVLLGFNLLSVYWMAISLALSYKVIMANSSTQTH
tara:strand:- start:41 stop:706 length:666 start_codon:yes stop_codon:yes gene_type:complete